MLTWRRTSSALAMPFWALKFSISCRLLARSSCSSSCACSIRQHTSAYVSIRLLARSSCSSSCACSIRQHTSAYGCSRAPAAAPPAPGTQLLRRQYWYFCTSNAAAGCSRAPPVAPPAPGTQLLRRQYLYFCTRKASTRSTCCRSLMALASRCFRWVMSSSITDI
jgi:hypothetical protein